MRFSLAAVALPLAFACFAGCRGGEERPGGRFGCIESILQEGDLLFRCGRGVASRAVLMADKGGVYSHVGVAVLTPEGWGVVHVLPGEPDENGVEDRVRIERVEQFFAPRRAVSGAVARVRNLSEGGDTAVAARAAQRALGTAARGVAFDHDYDLDDTTRMYCTELVWSVFMHEGLDVAAGMRSRLDLPGFRGNYLLPGDLLRSPHVRTICEFRQ